MINHIKEAELAQYIIMSGGKFLDYDSEKKCYALESNQTKAEWRLALTRTRFSEFSRGVSELIKLKKEAN